MKTLLASSAVALLAMTGAALAGGPVVIVQPPLVVTPSAPSYDWTGAYAGVHGGFGRIDDHLLPFDVNPIGVHAGYLFDFGSIVAGAEVSYTYFNEAIPGAYSSVHGKVRLGYDAGRFLPYVTGGIGGFNVDVRGTDMTYLLGGGVDFAVTDHFRVGGEYLWENNPAWQVLPGPAFDLDIHTFVLRASYAF